MQLFNLKLIMRHFTHRGKTKESLEHYNIPSLQKQELYTFFIFFLLLNLTTNTTHCMDKIDHEKKQKPKKIGLRHCASMDNLSPFAPKGPGQPAIDPFSTVRKSLSGSFYTTIGKKYSQINDRTALRPPTKKIVSLKETKTNPAFFHITENDEETSPDLPLNAKEEQEAVTVTKVPSDLDLNGPEIPASKIVCVSNAENKHSDDTNLSTSLHAITSPLLLLNPPPTPTLPLDARWLTKSKLPEQIPHYLTLQLCKEMGRELEEYLKTLQTGGVYASMPTHPFKIILNLDEVEKFIKKKITQKFVAKYKEQEEQLNLEMKELTINNLTLQNILANVQAQYHEYQKKHENLLTCNKQLASSHAALAEETAQHKKKYEQLLRAVQAKDLALQKAHDQAQKILKTSRLKKRYTILRTLLITLNFLSMYLLYQHLNNPNALKL